MKIDLEKREVYLDRSWDVFDIYTKFKNLWITEAEYSAIHFPIKRYGEGDNSYFEFINRWKFGDVLSHSFVRGKLSTPLPIRPLFPIAPKDIIHYRPKIFTPPIVFEEVMRSVPKDVPLAAVRLEGHADGRVILSVPGHWPNVHLKGDKKKHLRDIDKWVNEVKVYEKDLRMWTDALEEREK
jgi:hypothetical protein